MLVRSPVVPTVSVVPGVRRASSRLDTAGARSPPGEVSVWEWGTREDDEVAGLQLSGWEPIEGQGAPPAHDDVHPA